MINCLLLIPINKFWYRQAQLTNIENIFSGAYSDNISKAYLSADNLVSILVYTNNGICINYK